MSRFVLLWVVLCAGALEAAPLFSRPLHLTRSVQEPLSGSTVVVEQYLAGSRVVSVRGDRTVIADYERREITEIDRAAGTYSVTKFEEMAAARPMRRAQTIDAAPVPQGSDRRGGRAVELFTADDRAAGVHAEIAVDFSVELSRDAFDVLAGAAYPAQGGPLAELVRGTAASGRYGLPIEQIVRWDAAGETITSINRVTRVGEETAPPDVIAIPPGARQTQSHQLETRRLADDIDSVPVTRKH